MSRSTGSYITTTTLGESVKAFVPFDLPPKTPTLAEASYRTLNQHAELALAKLNGVSGLVPSVDWLIYAAVRKEALLTSQIEGTQATLVDLFDTEAHIAVDNPHDVEEVVNYVKAFAHVRSHLRGAHDSASLPLCMRLLCQAHQLLMDGARGTRKQPGQIRQSQNWIGGTRPGNAVFVPAPADKVLDLLSALERYINAGADAQPEALPALVRTALVHAQFETIHPFLDGNGRIGRLLIAAMMEDLQLLSEPLLYMSSTLKRHQSEYYRRLGTVRTEGDWEGWVSFFLEAVAEAAAESERTVIDIASLINHDRKKLLASTSMAQASYRLFELLPSMPRFTVESAKQALQASFPTANTAIQTLAELGIVKETTGRKKNRQYGYQAYIDRLAA
jgi:Fic family protein